MGVSDWEKKLRAKIAIFPRMLGLSHATGNEFTLVYIHIPTFSVFPKSLRNFLKKILYIERDRVQSGKVGISSGLFFPIFRADL